MSASAVRISDTRTVARHARALADLGAPFDDLLARNGPPPLWRRPATFGTIVRLVLEQQVSLASAMAAYTRLEQRVGTVSPAAVLASSAEELRADGFSRQKDRYVRGIAAAIERGAFSPPVPGDDQTEAAASLRSLTGIGPWTTACYLLFVLGAPDVWPRGDRALHVAMGRALGAEPPDSEAADTIARAWSPHRSTAARMLWHDYLGGRSHVPSPAAGFL